MVERYRHGHEMVHGNGASGAERTENLRKAMVDFRTVFERVVESPRRPSSPLDGTHERRPGRSSAGSPL